LSGSARSPATTRTRSRAFSASLEKTLSKKERSPIFPITPRFNESYDYVVVIATNDMDAAFLRTHGSRCSKEANYKNSGVGTSHVLTVERAIAKSWASTLPTMGRTMSRAGRNDFAQGRHPDARTLRPRPHAQARRRHSSALPRARNRSTASTIPTPSTSSTPTKSLASRGSATGSWRSSTSEDVFMVDDDIVAIVDLTTPPRSGSTAIVPRQGPVPHRTVPGHGRADGLLHLLVRLERQPPAVHASAALQDHRLRPRGSLRHPQGPRALVAPGRHPGGLLDQRLERLQAPHHLPRQPRRLRAEGHVSRRMAGSRARAP
jgi:hypothetical protein